MGALSGADLVAAVDLGAFFGAAVVLGAVAGAGFSAAAFGVVALRVRGAAFAVGLVLGWAVGMSSTTVCISGSCVLSMLTDTLWMLIAAL